MDGTDTVGIDGHFQVKGIIVELDRRAVNAGGISGIGLWSGILCFSGTEHKKDQYTQDHKEKKENTGVDHLFHM